MKWLADWLNRRRKQRVLRRLAKLDAQIASVRAEYVNFKVFADRFSNFGQARELGQLAGKLAHLEKIRAHNVEHGDLL